MEDVGQLGRRQKQWWEEQNKNVKVLRFHGGGERDTCRQGMGWGPSHQQVQGVCEFHLKFNAFSGPPHTLQVRSSSMSFEACAFQGLKRLCFPHSKYMPCWNDGSTTTSFRPLPRVPFISICLSNIPAVRKRVTPFPPVRAYASR